ncbi:MAG: hypothetical protein KBD76_02645 [Bacteriovorax sp.]|nr:hypothetical protein [Bacteriovorax sp.]
MKFVRELLTFLILFHFGCARLSTTPPTERHPAGLISSCFTILKHFLPSSEKENISLQKLLPQTSLEGLIYPKGEENKFGRHIQFGFESEYTKSEAEMLLKSYMPIPSMYNGSMEMWLDLDHKQRVQFLEENRELIFPFRQKGKMIKITKDPELQAVLPDSFVFDVNHFEIILDPMDSKESLLSKVRIINQYLGVGSMQIMISSPLNKSRLSKEKRYAEELKKELLGYYNFINDLDTLTKLKSRHQNYLAAPEEMAVRSFHHPWLGPMTKLKHERLKKVIEGIVNQNPKIKREVDEIPSNIESPKFIGGLAFRPDVAYKEGRMASEIRDCDKDLKCLEEKIDREIFFLSQGRERFAPFRKLISFDSMKDFNTKIPMLDRSTLKMLFPAYQRSSEKELELYRNFAFPYRDWSKHVELLGKVDLKMRIEEAQNNYSYALREISLECQMRKISYAAAQAKVIGELTTFVHKSGLASAFQDKLNELIIGPI